MQETATEIVQNDVQTKPTSRKGRTKTTSEIDYKAEVKRLTSELNFANNKIEDLKRIVESMKGQAAQLEQQLKNTIIKNKASKEYMLDCVKHAYIAITMAVKEGE